MKYIKLFEDSMGYDGEYWLVPTDKRLRKTLTKLRVSGNRIDNYSNSVEIGKYKYIFVGRDYEENIWGWMPYNDKRYSNNYFLIECNYEYRGVVGLTKKEKEEIELNDATKKYNL